MTADTSSPGERASRSQELRVIVDVTSCPSPSSITISAITCPVVTSLTVPSSRFRALRPISSVLFWETKRPSPRHDLPIQRRYRFCSGCRVFLQVLSSFRNKPNEHEIHSFKWPGGRGLTGSTSGDANNLSRGSLRRPLATRRRTPTPPARCPRREAVRRSDRRVCERGTIPIQPPRCPTLERPFRRSLVSVPP